MNTQTTDKTSELTGPQQRILDYITKSGGLADAAVIQGRGLDVRAANNLVRKNMLTLTNGVYRLVRATMKTAEKAEEPAVTVREPAAEVPATKEPTKAEPAKAAKAAARAEKAKTPIKNVELKPCLCGCGFASKSRFLPGHDARLHSIVLKIHRGKMGKDEMTYAPATLTYLKTAPWMTDEIAASIDLDRQDRQLDMLAQQ